LSAPRQSSSEHKVKRIKLIKSNHSKSPLDFEKLHENKDYFNLEINNKFQILDIEGCNDIDEINKQQKFS